MARSGFEIFQSESPEVAAAFNALIESLAKPSALDPKTKHLVYIAMKVATGDPSAVVAHVPMAKKLGATREEIRETILLTLTVCGLKGINSGLAAALEAYDRS
jgi:AhpD family alkylhydroperoxidase